MKAACTSFVLICVATSWGQTRVDLSNQTKNVDFSAATATRPTKTGTLLPATCKTGDVFFKLDATPGSNLFGCTAVNVWSLLGGGGGSGISAATFQTLITDSVTGSTSTVVSVGAGTFRSGNVISTVSLVATIQANASSLSSGAQMWIEFDPVSQTRVALTNSQIDQANLSLVNIVLGAETASGFTAGRIPISYCQGGSTTDQWSFCTDVRTPFIEFKLNAGSNMQLSNESDGSVTVAAALASNPVNYGVAGAAATCPASWTTLVAKALSSNDQVAAGDVLKVLGVFERTGSEAIELEILFAGAALLGGVAMGSNTYVIESSVMVTDASSIAASTVVRRDSDGTTVSAVKTATALTIGSTPAFEFRARNCSAASIRLVKGFVVHYHDSGL